MKDQFASLVRSVRLERLPFHDCIHPSATDYASEDVPERVRYVQQADYDSREIIWLSFRCILNTDVQNIKRTEGDGRIVHRQQHRHEPDVQDDP